jgi:hypothetical protein
MPENNDNLKQALKEGDLDLTKNLLESGSSLPRQYTYHVLPKYERRLCRNALLYRQIGCGVGKTTPIHNAVMLLTSCT